MRAAIAGTPDAAASIRAMPKGSYQRLGKTRKRAPFICCLSIFRAHATQ